LLVAVKSCRADLARGYHQAIRDTWGSDIKDADLRFFVGQGETISDLREDEEVVNVPDDYDSLPQKTLAILDWAESQNYDFIFLADTDTYVVINKLMKCGFEKVDYMGHNTWPLGVAQPYVARDRHGKDWPMPQCYAWMSGGYGYFLSRKAAAYVLGSKPPLTWAEDVMVGQILGPLYNMGLVKIQNIEPNITFHFPQGEYKSGYDLKFKWQEWMYEGRG
jgi:hypothetical protein